MTVVIHRSAQPSGDYTEPPSKELVATITGAERAVETVASCAFNPLTPL